MPSPIKNRKSHLNKIRPVYRKLTRVTRALEVKSS